MLAWKGLKHFHPLEEIFSPTGSLACVIATYYVCWFKSNNQSGQIHHRRPLFCQFAEGKIHCTRQIIKPGSATVLILQSGQRCEGTWRNGLCFNKEMWSCHIRVTTSGFPVQPILQTKVQEQKWDTYMSSILFQMFSVFLWCTSMVIRLANFSATMVLYNNIAS